MIGRLVVTAGLSSLAALLLPAHSWGERIVPGLLSIFPSIVAPAGGTLCGDPHYDLQFTLGSPGGACRNEGYALWVGFGARPTTTVLCALPSGTDSQFDQEQPIPRVISIAPNPASGRVHIVYEVTGESKLDLAVVGATGRVIWDFPGASIAPGRHSIAWDGRDNLGRRAPSGVYFLRSTVGARKEHRTLIVVR
jgi:hypothetical protein